MDKQLEQLVQSIHDAPTQLVLVIAGAGHSALGSLLSVAGASRTILEGLVPYSAAAFDEFLGFTPPQHVTSATVRHLAGRAYTRARQLVDRETDLLGIACTATIATDRQKRGDHRAYIAVWQCEQVVETFLFLEKGQRDRAGEEALVSRVMLNAISQACGLTTELPLALGAGDRLVTTMVDFRGPATALATGERHWFGIHADGQLYSDAERPQAILSGSFNPLHTGHLGMATAAAAMIGAPITFELSAVNVDKPPLPAAQILARMGQFAGRHGVVASDAPTYLGKARLYPGTTFVVGYDTAVRIFAPRYYGNSEAAMLEALAEIQGHGCHFLVAGRADEQGVFHSLDEIAIPAQFAPMFTAIPEANFRHDISSTTLRATGEGGSR